LVNVAVVIPCFRASSTILSVISGIGAEVSSIIVVDDACPERSGKLVVDTCTDTRVSVTFHSVNQGVGGAVKTGYQIALDSGADVVVKLDADGQMDPRLIELFLFPILRGRADYSKRNNRKSSRDAKNQTSWECIFVTVFQNFDGLLEA